ncbi:MAG: phosphoribosylpyrophosphate synthetase [Ferruginibacter sp.]|nr:phosphoribosylpyrophosphate synthetase [Ferruginibacter sp.]
MNIDTTGSNQVSLCNFKQIKSMETYDTVVAALNGLREKGYTLDFNIAFDKLQCVQNNECLNPAEFEIVEVHRFEGNTNPDDEDVVYAVSSHDGKLKGVVTSAFGMYADPIDTEMIRKLTMHIK